MTCIYSLFRKVFKLNDILKLSQMIIIKYVYPFISEMLLIGCVGR